MQPPDPRLEEIKMLENAAGIETTKRHAGLSKFTYDKDSIRLRPDLTRFYFGFLFCCIPWVMLCTVLLGKDRSHSSIPGVTALVAMGIGLPVIVILQARKAAKTSIFINASGITLNETFYDWNDIYATAILNRYRSISLVIVPKDSGPYQLFDLSGFYTTTLSKYIEHFKPTGHQANQ